MPQELDDGDEEQIESTAGCIAPLPEPVVDEVFTAADPDPFRLGRRSIDDIVDWYTRRG